jgi:hypothetical protein
MRDDFVAYERLMFCLAFIIWLYLLQRCNP